MKLRTRKDFDSQLFTKIRMLEGESESKKNEAEALKGANIPICGCCYRTIEMIEKNGHTGGDDRYGIMTTYLREFDIKSIDKDGYVTIARG